MFWVLCWCKFRYRLFSLKFCSSIFFGDKDFQNLGSESFPKITKIPEFAAHNTFLCNKIYNILRLTVKSKSGHQQLQLKSSSTITKLLYNCSHSMFSHKIKRLDDVNLIELKTSFYTSIFVRILVCWNITSRWVYRKTNSGRQPDTSAPNFTQCLACSYWNGKYVFLVNTQHRICGTAKMNVWFLPLANLWPCP